MYVDPTLIREHVVKIRMNDPEAALIEALVNYTGQQKASLLRELLLEQARLVLSGQGDYAPGFGDSEGPLQATGRP